MIPIEKLLDMVATEAIEDSPIPPKDSDKLPPIRYNLELIRRKGRLHWAE